MASANPPENRLAIKLTDSTMAPRFKDDTVIVVNRALNPKNGDYVVVYLDNKQTTYFRQWLVDGNDIYLKAMNQDFPLLPVMSDYFIVGVVIEAHINLGRQ